MIQNEKSRTGRIHRPVETYAPAFFAFLAIQLTDRITSEGARFSTAIGLEIPVNTMSTIMVLKEGPASVTEIASALNVSHVAVIKTIRILNDKGILERRNDPSDGRRKPLSLTSKGTQVAADVSTVIEKAQSVYRELFEEIGVDLHEALLKMNAALDRISFDNRLARA
ncbi:MarR family transcriptional regulator [Parasphingorhabdus sp.]|uniref:MarR family transcriptional regulator n=1 Tax=Parasphingorhabdus sp. TaxID=2709688 RepID=UPI003A947732